ncbi:Hypothetical predicted protein [Podarcis lilfordi]|uniref:Uncharacterized protein n=1 Tax=Podarcis lilfordi TaxID=74358 RepID=A0AA35P0V8_9SAUR|nr:Hypothetical predicted protein [Podarcis lilfordi]
MNLLERFLHPLRRWMRARKSCRRTVVMRPLWVSILVSLFDISVEAVNLSIHEFMIRLNRMRKEPYL